jgi:hypothetical protein
MGVGRKLAGLSGGSNASIIKQNLGGMRVENSFS